jgi:hypothetical protein
MFMTMRLFMAIALTGPLVGAAAPSVRAREATGSPAPPPFVVDLNNGLSVGTPDAPDGRPDRAFARREPPVRGPSVFGDVIVSSMQPRNPSSALGGLVTMP